MRGRLDYKLHAGQKLIRQKYRSVKNQLFVGECSRQFGKSYLLVTEAIETAIRKPRARVKYATAFATDLIDFIMPTFEEVLRDCPKACRPKYKVQGQKWIFPNGSEIKLVGLDRKPNGLRGNVIDLIILDEAGFMSRLDYLYKSVIIPATTHRPDCRILVFSTPPETPAHEFLDYVQKAELEGAHCKFTIYDNPMVDELTIQRLMRESGGETSTTWKREYLCQHIVDQDLAIVGSWRDEHVQEVKKDDYYPYYYKYVFMDLGVLRDHTAVIFGYYDFLKATLVIEDEFIINGPTLTTKILHDTIRAKERDLWGLENARSIFRISDNNNPLLLQDLSHLHGLHFTPTTKTSLQEMVNRVKLMVANGQILVHPRCKQTVGCLKYGVWDKKRSEFARSNVFGHFDALAALIYGVRNLNLTTNPIPPSFHVNFDNQILLNPTRDSAAASNIKNAFGLRGK